MEVKKRNRRSRIRGTRVCGYGFGKKHKGKGSKGGVGMAGTGKKAGQKVTLIHAKFPDYFGKKGFKSIKQIKNTEKIINLLEIEKYMDKLTKKGIAKKTAEGIELNLPNYKILGFGEVKNKLIIKARAVSAGAKEKIEKAGGRISVEESNPLEETAEKKTEEPKKEKKKEGIVKDIND